MTTKMTEQQFREWAATAAFTFADNIDGETEAENQVDTDDETGKPILSPSSYACAWRTARATLPDGSVFEATYQTGVEWSGTTRERFEDAYEEFDMGVEEVLIDGVILYEGVGEFDEDIDDELIDECEIEGIVKAAIPELTRINFQALLPAVKTEDIDIDEEDETMETITLENDNAPAIRFTGELVAETSSSNNNASSYYSGQTGRWTTLKLYKTKGGKFVAQSIGHTQWQGEHDRHKSAVCEDEAAVIAFFGHGWLAKDLYEEAGIEDVQDVE